jgi:hypothetical protein
MPGGGIGLTIMTLGFDPAKTRFVGTFIGSMMTHMWIYDGQLDAAGKVLTLDAEGPSFTDPAKMAKFQDMIEIKSDDQRTADAVAKLDHQHTRTCITAERAFLRRLEGGCQVPIGAHATMHRENMTLEGMVGSLDGSVVFRERITGKATDADVLGTKLADDLVALGARELLDNTREQAAASNQVTL